MKVRAMRWLVLLVLPVMLASCFFVPGRFTSTLSVNADRSFAFTYVGEVISVDPSGEIAKGMADMKASGGKAAGAAQSPAARAQAKAEADRKNQQIAEALAREVGYRKVTYLGDGRFMIDYAIKGVLDHDFIYPFNLDAEAVFPFIALELRNGGTVRVKAPAFARGDDKSPMNGMNESGVSKLDGVFTLDTDAEVVSQNNEDGVKLVDGRKTMTWKATPLSKDPPTAVLRFR